MYRILLSIFLISNLLAKEKKFVQEYTYQVSENDSKATSRTNALEQIKKLLLEEASEFSMNEVDWIQEKALIAGKYINKDIYEQNIKLIIAEITEINITYEFWNTKIYLLKGNITLNTEHITTKMNNIIATKQELGGLGEIINNDIASDSDKSIIPVPIDLNRNDLESNKLDSSRLPNMKYVAYDIPPKPIIPIKPVYPEVSKKAGIEGTIYIQYFIDQKGNVTEAHVVKGMPGSGLDESALSAVRNSSWEPALQGEMKVGIWQTIPVKFQLDSN